MSPVEERVVRAPRTANPEYVAGDTAAVVEIVANLVITFVSISIPKRGVFTCALIPNLSTPLPLTVTLEEPGAGRDDSYLASRVGKVDAVESLVVKVRAGDDFALRERSPVYPSILEEVTPDTVIVVPSAVFDTNLTLLLVEKSSLNSSVTFFF